VVVAHLKAEEQQDLMLRRVIQTKVWDQLQTTQTKMQVMLETGGQAISLTQMASDYVQFNLPCRLSPGRE
jgi:hypothetical protein